MNRYTSGVFNQLQQKFSDQPEYLQAVRTWLDMIEPALDDPRYERQDLLSRMVLPERMLTFQVPWTDDNGMTHTNLGYRVQFNSALGPYKGGLRFHAEVNPSIVKFLGFEQTFKNALTGLPIGGAAGGADFDPRGKSEREIMRFCQSYMTALYRNLGPDTDIAGGDIGVGAREIGYLYGQYRRLTARAQQSVVTGKAVCIGGSPLRSDAAGSSAVYFLDRMLEHQGDCLKGKKIAVSGFGSMALGVCKKAALLGAKVVTLSGPDGYVYDADGICTIDKFDFIGAMRTGGDDCVAPYAKRFKLPFVPGKRPWNVPVDIVMPCATQNELTLQDAFHILNNGVQYYVECSNMAATDEAISLLRSAPGIVTAGAKAAGCGGVAVSALEISQNRRRTCMTKRETDLQLRQIMSKIYDESVAAAQKYGLGYDLIAGSSIAAFQKVAAAMLAQGF